MLKKISKFLIHNLWETTHALFCILNYGDTSRRQVLNAWMFSLFLFFFFLKNSSSMKTGKNFSYYWKMWVRKIWRMEGSQLLTGAHLHLPRLGPLTIKISPLSGKLFRKFLFSVWITQRVAGECLSMAFSQIDQQSISFISFFDVLRKA